MKIKFTSVTGQAKHQKRGFSKVDALVLFAALGLLVVTGFAAATKTGYTASRIMCTNNLKQFGLAIRSNALDNDDRIVQNEEVIDSSLPQAKRNWVNGRLSLDRKNKDNTNDLFLAESPLYNELGSTKVFKCPGDTTGRNRSYAMNAYVGSRSAPYTSGFDHIESMESIHTDIWVMMDQHERSIDDGALEFALVDPSIQEKQEVYVKDYPATRHSTSFNTVLIDGSVTQVQWADNTTAQVLDKQTATRTLPNTNKDYLWFLKHSAPGSYKKVRLGVKITPSPMTEGIQIEWKPPALVNWNPWSPDYTPVGYGVTRLRIRSGKDVLYEGNFQTRNDPTDITVTLTKSNN